MEHSGKSNAGLVVALSGASGAPYCLRLLEILLQSGRTIHLTISPAAAEVLAAETDRTVRLDRFELADLLGDKAALCRPGQLHYHHVRDFRAGIASGSFL